MVGGKPKHAALLLPWRGNVIGDSVRDTALAAHVARVDDLTVVYYLCGTHVATLLEGDGLIKPLLCTHLDVLTSDVSPLYKGFALLRAFVWLRFHLPAGVRKVVYTGSAHRLRAGLARVVAFVLGADYEHLGFGVVAGIASSSLVVLETDGPVMQQGDVPLVAVCVETTDARRLYDWKEWLAVIADLVVDTRVVLLGLDQDLAAQMVTAVPACVDLVGKLPLRESAAVIKQADVFVGLDSGLAHVAGAVGTDCVIVSVCDSVGQDGLLHDRTVAQAVVLEQPAAKDVLVAVRTMLCV